MSQVRAKFTCTDKMTVEDGYHVIMEPVTCGSEENEKFYKFTPYGRLELGTINEEAADALEVGQEYFIDISQA